MRSSPGAQKCAREAEPGDIVYVWRGGGKRPGSGLIAQLRITEPAREAVNPPWPDGEAYSYVIPIELIAELPESIPDSFPGHRLSQRFKIQNTDVQKGFRQLSAESEEQLGLCFP
ncbi:hypothetical protein GOHSU_22_00330 [Gordonia hirsuta DSM 44140 = NBRC 16056]|uniref:EVE domain-containing protein n=1 Tax=Gordonia hirsuta DSM 44140 = NBRC 16056 TaxID=1121927 RepID=L7LC20_9ACTN|nr:hypothetical protein GOHSU_22_00330 [Gordonia hirsuta DSM 44140 = NBRC 16056]